MQLLVRPEAPGEDRDCELVTEMSGHSGCRVLLYRRGETHFVRKISGTPGYNRRLELQREKQSRLSAVVSTPPVIGFGMLGELAYFDMQYVRGHDFKVYAPLQNIGSLSRLLPHVVAPIWLFAERAHGCLPEALFASKVTAVSAAVHGSTFFPAHASVLEPVIAHLQAADWAGVPASPNHGDLTMENMIITDSSELVMIDLLDGELESFWMDAAKLLHDLDSGWSLRSMLWKRQTSSSERLIAILSRYLYDELDAELRALFPDLAARLLQLRALQAMRVLPYVTDRHIFWYVVRGLDRLFQRETR